MTMRRSILLFLGAISAQAHVGSPDIFLQGNAGPYKVFVTVRPPTVIPGVAEVEIRGLSTGIREIRIAPTPLTGAAARFAPTPDTMQRSKSDSQFFTGSLWMMASGSWQVRIQADGAQGSGQLSVPVPALATRTKPMQFALAALLLAMTVLLGVGVVSIVGAAVREGTARSVRGPGYALQTPRANVHDRGRRADRGPSFGPKRPVVEFLTRAAICRNIFTSPFKQR